MLAGGGVKSTLCRETTEQMNLLLCEGDTLTVSTVDLTGRVSTDRVKVDEGGD